MRASKRPDPRLVRTDGSWLTLPNPFDVPVEISAGPEVPIESAAVDELLTVLETADTLRQLAAASGERQPRLDRLVCSPRRMPGSDPHWQPQLSGRSGRPLSKLS
jgi:tRNA-splicing ligase RtcB